MTVISTFIVKSCTIHASDSLLTVYKGNGKFEPEEHKRSKIIPVRRFRGAMSYWGLAKYQHYNWSTYDWLLQKAGEANNYSTPEDFATFIAQQLNQSIAGMHFPKPKYSSIGIHFTAYEYIDGYQVPELFLISNWANTTYDSIRPNGCGTSRETYGTVEGIIDRLPEHREPKYRHAVYSYLQSGGVLMYNNGDPAMFNTVLNMFSLRACLKIMSVHDGDQTNGAFGGWKRGKPCLRSHLFVARSPYSSGDSD